MRRLPGSRVRRSHRTRRNERLATTLRRARRPPRPRRHRHVHRTEFTRAAGAYWHQLCLSSAQCARRGTRRMRAVPRQSHGPVHPVPRRILPRLATVDRHARCHRATARKRHPRRPRAAPSCLARLVQASASQSGIRTGPVHARSPQPHRQPSARRAAGRRTRAPRPPI